jgi:hypothetical protein
MRDENDRGLAGDPQREMAELARRFPGALRELDELPPEMLEQRLAVLEAVCEDRAQPPQWVVLQISYHGLLRAVLRIKRLSAGRGRAEAAAVLAELTQRYAPASDEPDLGGFDHAALCAILEPPGGRLNPWVFARVAERHGVSPEIVRQALFVR